MIRRASFPEPEQAGSLPCYVFQASLLCEECASDVRDDVPFPHGADPEDEATWDSDEWPKGPYPDGGGEADSPQHCDCCGLFLGNPLTAEGREYVQQAVQEAQGACWRQWATYYGIRAQSAGAEVREADGVSPGRSGPDGCYLSVPAGTYLCEVAEIRTRTSRAGDELWSLRLVVVEGEHAGRHAAYDNLVWSLRGRARLRRVLRALGLTAEGCVGIEPEDLQGRRALVEVRPVAYTNDAGETIRRNEVPYDGYRPAPEQRAGGAA